MSTRHTQSKLRRERVEMLNLENYQFEELIINPTFTYYHLYFEMGPVKTDKGLGLKNIW